jgi:hypothetical protein
MKKLLTILTALISMASYGQQHYPIKNFLAAVCHPWDITPGIGVYKNHDLLLQRTQNSIVSLRLHDLRLYNDVYACKDTSNLTYRLSPEQRGFPTDEALISLKNKIPGLGILYCYQGMPTSFQKEYNAAGVKSTVYSRYGSDASSSLSYLDIAHDCYVLASRGGRNKNVPDYPLYVGIWWEPQQVMYKGAAFIDAIEGGNEWDNRYSNDRPLNGMQYAVAWSPTYDSIKKADPSMLVSTTGLCEADPKTLADAWTWVNQNRGGKFPADMIQVHSYPWSWYRGLSGGSPGEYSIIPEVKKMIDAAKGVPVIVGEWSWDIHRDSPINAPAFSSYSAEKSRALLAVRTIIKFSQIGVFKSYWYRINQDYFTGDPLGGNFANDNNGIQFATSALRRQVDDSGHFVKTTVGDYFTQLNQFGDYSYKDSEVDNDSLQIHRLADPVGRIAYALWTTEIITPWTDWRGVSHPEFTERKINHSLPAGTTYRFSDDSSGVMQQQHIAAGPVELNSKPFLFVPDPVAIPLPVHLVTFTAQKINQAAVIKYAVQDASKVEVERSTDGRTWINLGEGIFNNVIDRNPAPGRNYYRLKMYEQDGSFTYSFIRTLAITGVHARLYVHNIAGQTVKRGWSEDADRIKTELRTGKYYFEYILDGHTSYTEPFLKL